MTAIEILGKKHSIPILITLYKNKSFEKGKTFQKQLKEEIGHKTDTVKNRLFELREMDLANFEASEEFQHKEYSWLTPKGKRVAEKLVEIEEIIKKS